jgi:hypothetical protein
MERVLKNCINNGWHFDNTGGGVVVGWKNVTLKDGTAGCVTVSTDSVVIHRHPSKDSNEFADLIWDEKHVLKTYVLGNEKDSELIPPFLHDVLEDTSANAVCEDLDGIWRYGLVT